MLFRYTPNVESDSNNIWIGAKRTQKNSVTWGYLQQPAPANFNDGNVPWGRRQPDDRYGIFLPYGDLVRINEVPV